METLQPVPAVAQGGTPESAGDGRKPGPGRPKGSKNRPGAFTGPLPDGMRPAQAIKALGRQTRYSIPGAKDHVARHPLRDEIDQAILTRALPHAEIARKYELPGTWTVARRAAALKAQMHLRARRNEVAGLKDKQDRAEKRVLGMIDSAQEMARRGFDKIMDTAVEPADIERSATFLDKYLNSIRIYGEATGEIVAGGPQVQVDNRQLYVMSLPRASDPPEVLEAAENMLRIGPSQGKGEVIQIEAEGFEEEE